MGVGKGALEEMVISWSSRRVFLTGHTGFKGSWLSLWLAKLGAIVRGYSLAPDTQPNLFTLARIEKAVDHRIEDIRDFAPLKAAMIDFAPEVVFHLAAQPLVLRSYKDPLGTYSTNVMGTVHVLEAARSCPSVRAIVCVTTDKCYENNERNQLFRETDSLGGHDPYASSKACAEIVAAAYRSSYFAPGTQPQVGLATARAGNVIGGGDWSQDRLIPDVVRAFSARQPVRIRNPKSTRPWQHVLDPLYGYILLAENLLKSPVQFSTAYNFGPDPVEERSVEQVVEKIASLRGKGDRCIVDSAPGEHESRVLRLDSSKARAELGWRPRLSFPEALEWTVKWYGAWERAADMQEVTLAQISAYEQRSDEGASH